MSFGWTEILLLILFIYLLFFSKKLPQLAKGFRGMLTGFKQGIDDTPDIDITDDAKKPREKEHS
ncbi:MAG: twin-arginine translocase TatA/TatE family subunit [Pseudobdellovibrionaceae bacterium]